MARNPHIEAVLRDRYRGRRKVPKIVLQAEPRGLERSYLRDIVRLVQPAKELVDNLLISRLPEFDREITVDALNLDAYPDELERIFADIRLRFGQVVDAGDVRGLANGQGTQLDLFNREQTARQFKKLLGIDVFTLTPQLTRQISAFTVDNVALIKSIAERYFTEIENTALRNLRAGNRSTEWQGELEKRYNVSKSRAALIARDQTNKFNGELNKTRQESLGIDGYTWRTSEDERVRGNPAGKYPNARPSHYARNGKKYKWDSPPSDGHPGQPVQCRCQAEPDVDAELERLGI